MQSKKVKCNSIAKFCSPQKAFCIPKEEFSSPKKSFWNPQKQFCKPEWCMPNWHFLQPKKVNAVQISKMLSKKVNCSPKKKNAVQNNKIWLKSIFEINQIFSQCF
jgi:hypothetical protein